MTDKDPKDMTASDLLRWAASLDKDCYGQNAPQARLLSALSSKEYYLCDYRDYAAALSFIADKIDAELAHARRSGLERAAKSWAKANGWPDFREGEVFGAWLERCAIPRPRFEDGEPVHIGDKAAYPTTGETCTIDCINTFDDSYCIGFVGKTSKSLFDGERLKRPAPEALGADGLPIVEGETVYDIETGCRHVVALPLGGTGKTFFDDGGYRDPAYITHTPPDTQEKIDEDALKDSIDYWGCCGIDCEECPSMIDGMTPNDHYKCLGCAAAAKLDLLRRQRELDKRTGGAE